MAHQAERQQFAGLLFARFTLMHRDRPLSTFRRGASKYPATVAVALQHFLTMAAEVVLVLTLEGVASRTQSFRKDFRVPARTVQNLLTASFNSLLPRHSDKASGD